MRPCRFLVSVILFIAPVASTRADNAPEAVTVGHVNGLSDIVLREGKVTASGSAGNYQIVAAPDGAYGLAPQPPEQTTPVPYDILPGGRLAHGKRDIRLAWYAEPTWRYGHGVLGDAIEASALKVESASGITLAYKLSGESVFEDIAPRIVETDGDDHDEIIAVRSYLKTGAAVSLFGIRLGGIALLAESPAIGRANRWLNPVGAADFDGDGRVEIAAVLTPHIGGVLTIYRIADKALVEVGRAPGYSTHAIGSTVLDMAAIADIDGDGAADIVLPDQARRALHAVSFAGRKFRTLWSVDNPATVVTSVVAADVDGNDVPDITYGLADGTVMLLRH